MYHHVGNIHKMPVPKPKEDMQDFHTLFFPSVREVMAQNAQICNNSIQYTKILPRKSDAKV